MSTTHRPPYVFAVIVMVLGLAMLAPGVKLLSLGGSLYYVMAGAALIASGALLWRRSLWGARGYGIVLLGTLLWGLSEVGLDLWALLPRLLALSVIGLW